MGLTRTSQPLNLEELKVFLQIALFIIPKNSLIRLDVSINQIRAHYIVTTIMGAQETISV